MYVCVCVCVRVRVRLENIFENPLKSYLCFLSGGERSGSNGFSQTNEWEIFDQFEQISNLRPCALKNEMQNYF